VGEQKACRAESLVRCGYVPGYWTRLDCSLVNLIVVGYGRQHQSDYPRPRPGKQGKEGVTLWWTLTCFLPSLQLLAVRSRRIHSPYAALTRIRVQDEPKGMAYHDAMDVGGREELL